MRIILLSPRQGRHPRGRVRRPGWHLQTLLRLCAQRQVRHHDLHRASLLHSGGGPAEGGDHGVPGVMIRLGIHSDFTMREYRDRLKLVLQV